MFETVDEPWWPDNRRSTTTKMVAFCPLNNGIVAEGAAGGYHMLPLVSLVEDFRISGVAIPKQSSLLCSR